MKFYFLKNKRLQIALTAFWLLASFIIVRSNRVESINNIFQLSLASCYQLEIKESCINDATNQFEELLKITLIDLADTFFIFITPIIIIVLLLGLINWINNYEKNS